MTDSTDPHAPELLDVLAPEVTQTPEEVEAEDNQAPARQIVVGSYNWQRDGRKGGYYYSHPAGQLTKSELDKLQLRGGFEEDEALPGRKARTMYGAEGRFRIPTYARNQLARGFKDFTKTDEHGDTDDYSAPLGRVSNRSAHEYWPTFVRDVFATMYGMPKANHGQNEPAWARDLLDQIEEDENIRAIRRGAKLDPQVALDAAEKILNSIQPAPETVAQREEREAGGDQPSPDPEKMSDRQKRDAKKAAEAMQAAMQEASKDAKKAQDKHNAQSGGMGDGSDESDETGGGQSFESFNGHDHIDSERFTHVEPAEIEHISNIAGRAMSTAYNSRARNAAAPGGITDVECGRDVPRWLPAELALLACPETEMLALSRYAERSALQFKMEGDGDMGRGPIVLFIDLSGSMGAPDIHYRGQAMKRSVWAAGVALALWQVATWQNRECRLIGYTGSVCFDYLIDSEEKALEILSRSYYGGTSLGNAITYVKNKGYDKRADFVIVSDGEDWGWEGPAILAKRESDVRLHAVAIAGEWNCTDELDSYTHVTGDELDLSDQYAAL